MSTGAGTLDTAFYIPVVAPGAGDALVLQLVAAPVDALALHLAAVPPGCALAPQLAAPPLVLQPASPPGGALFLQSAALELGFVPVDVPALVALEILLRLNLR